MYAKWKLRAVCLFIFAGVSSSLFAGGLADRSYLSEPRWELKFSLGELPNQTFKPGISFGYHFNEYAYAGLILQAPNVIARDGESFNAASFGQNKLVTAWETTGFRALLEARFTPVLHGPYLSLGIVFNETDTERMYFAKSERTIGGTAYDSDLKIVQRRPRGIAPAIGIGWQVTLDNRTTFGTGWTAGLFTNIAGPEIDIKTSANVSDADKASLRKKIRRSFMDNMHNHYHIFTMEVGRRVD